MRICPKCGYVDPPEWKHRKYSYWIDNCLTEDFKGLHPNLAAVLDAQGHAEDEYFVYRLTKDGRRVERKAKVDYGQQWTIPMEKAYDKHNFRDFRPCWMKIAPGQKKLLDSEKRGGDNHEESA